MMMDRKELVTILNENKTILNIAIWMNDTNEVKRIITENKNIENHLKTYTANTIPAYHFN